MASQSSGRISPRAHLASLAACLSATGIGLSNLPAQSQCLLAASCSGTSQSSAMGAVMTESTGLLTYPASMSGPSPTVPTTQYSGFTETAKTTLGGFSRLGTGNLTEQGAPAGPQIRLQGNPDSVSAPDLTLGERKLTPEITSITPALTTRLQPASLSSYSAGVGATAPDSANSSLWNFEAILYKQDRTGSSCSLNRQGPQINTCR